MGRPRPRRSVTLELQAYQPGRGWRTVGTARTGKSGRYRFRAKAVRQAGLPFATGVSRTVIVSVRP